MTPIAQPKEIAPKVYDEHSLVLHNISLETYRKLMRDHENQSIPRFTFDQGDLEIFMPSEQHEETSELIGNIIYINLEERELDFRGLRSTTFRRDDVERGVEPDGCFYIANVEAVKNVERIDLSVQPPPDLVVEVDLTSLSIDKFPIYADFKVPEIWRFRDNAVTIYRRDEKIYVEAAESLSFPKVTGAMLTEFLQQSEQMSRAKWLRYVRRQIQAIID